jgi:SulP family sulfate permease
VSDARALPRTSALELYTPKLVTMLREGYRLSDLKADALSGLTVAVVALPLSMAIAIASGVSPDRGLYAAIVGGFLVSALGGSRFQIGGPAGAFILLVASTLRIHGLDGLILAVFLSGLILLAAGLLRIGTFIKFIPFPVTVGFTAGIAVTIAASQLKDLLGLHLAGLEPGPFAPKLVALAKAAPTASPAALAIGALTILAIMLVRRWRPHWPSMLIGVAVATLAGVLILPGAVETIGTRFGGLAHGLPLPRLPDLTPARIIEMLPSAGGFALLGGIESLLSAVVADSMSGRRHRSNAELAAQGVANIASSLFGGICVTGTIARTATNVRSGARGPVSGVLHSVFLLGFLLIAAPLAAYIPLAALAGLLMVVAWNMAEKDQFAVLLRTSRAEASVLLVTFLVVVFRDLIQGIVAGFCLAALLCLHRLSKAVEIEAVGAVREAESGEDEAPYAPAMASDPDVLVYRISGAFFFGSAATVAAALEEAGERPRAYVLDMSAVAVIDSTAAATIEGFIAKAARRRCGVWIAGAHTPVRRQLLGHGVRRPAARYTSDVAAAVEAAHHFVALRPAG